jgi:gliding motility-associated-like protein
LDTTAIIGWLLMSLIKLKFFLLIIFTALTIKTLAQTCTGSLGDPVINQDFSAGQNPGGALAGGTTNLTYTTNNCPDDGFYTISTSLTGGGNCHPDTWYNVTKDHTGSLNGYMMIVNASYQPSIFFTQPASGLCPNTTYYFSAYILNLIIPTSNTVNFTEPNITFSIESTSGQVLATNNTGTIPPSPTGPTWIQYGTFFTTPANVTNIVVKMTNNAPGGNGNDFILDDITFRACGPIINLGFAATNGPADKEICQGDNARYTLKAQVLGTNNPVYQWQYNYYRKGWSDIPGKTDDSLDVGFVNAITGSYLYRLGVANGSNSSAQCRVYSPVLSVNVNPLPVVPAIAPKTICAGNALQLTASGGATYTWTGPNMAPTSQNPLIINNVTTANAGTYTVVVSSASGCSVSPTPVIVKVVPNITPAISNDVSICAGETTQLYASGGVYYKWTPSTGLNNDTIPNPIATPSQTTTYHVDISNGGCADSSKSVTVTVNQPPVANAGSDKVIFGGQSVKLNGTVTGDNITNYYWSPSSFLDDPFSLTPTANPPIDITYTLTVLSQTCGISTSTVFVKVYQQITVPNAFSPNSDGINDNWNIDALVTYPQSSIMVYDRYGQKVYQSTGYAKPWDGTYNGSALPPGTYYYVIDLKNNTPKIAGWVFIVR